jgi:nucleotide-binding universal stress UspA family protein
MALSTYQFCNIEAEASDVGPPVGMPCADATWRGNNMELKRIVVGVDGSPAAASALRWAAQAAGGDGEIVAVHGTATALIAQAATSAATGLGFFPELEGRREEAQRLLEGQWRAVSSRASTGFLQRLFQGVCEGLIDEARRPVVVVPHSHRR